MTTINDIHDLVELLQDNPDWTETNRSLVGWKPATQPPWPARGSYTAAWYSWSARPTSNKLTGWHPGCCPANCRS